MVEKKQERGSTLNLYPTWDVHIHSVETVVRHILPSAPTRIERMLEGGSTYVYRIIFPQETFYLRILPEVGASFAPEAAVHSRLRQLAVKVPEVIYVEPYNELLQRSIMVTTEIQGQPLTQSQSLSQEELQGILQEAGRDLARLNSLPVKGFGWITRDRPTLSLEAQWATLRLFLLEFWNADLAFLAKNTLSSMEIVQLERVVTYYDAWLDSEQGYLAHGDMDISHIYQENGRYTGIIDFGEIRGASSWYDLGHFHMRDCETLPVQLEPYLVDGYREITPLPEDYEQHIRFTSLLINVRILARSLQKRPANRYTRHQLEVLRKDVAFL